MIKSIKSVIVLTVICAIVSILLAVTNNITAPIIEENAKAETNKSLTEVLPKGKDFEEIDTAKYEFPQTIIEAYRDKNAGCVFKIKVKGYKPDMIILCGIDNEGVVIGTKYFSGNETHKAKETYGERLLGKTISDISSVDIISGSTMTSAAYKNAVKDALNAFTILNGGTADLRSEEEIFNDNLNAALPDAEGKFEKVFLLEDIEGIDSVYKALNKQGFVFVIDNVFYATDADGKLVKTDADDNTTALISESAKKIINWESKIIDLSAYTNLPSQLKIAYKADNGYTLVLHAAGYGVNGGGSKYHSGNGVPIVIKVTATKDGTITSCVTVSQSESPDYGAACKDEKFYSQFNGKTEADYSQIDAISGATITTEGYKAAIGAVFEAIKIMEGVS